MTLRLSVQHPGRLYEMEDGGRGIRRLVRRSDQMSVPGTGGRNYYQSGDVIFQWNYNLKQLALQFNEFRANVHRDDFTFVDFMIAALDLDQFQVVGVLESFRHADNRYPFNFAMKTGEHQWVTLTRQQGSYTLRQLESAMNVSRSARSALIWDDVGRVVLAGSMSIFTGPARAMTRVAVRRLGRTAFRRVVKALLKRANRRLVRIVVRALLSRLARLTVAIAANIARKVGTLCFRGEMRNRMAADNPQLQINQRDLWNDVQSALPGQVQNAVAEEVRGLFTGAMADLLPGVTAGQSMALFGSMDVSFTLNFSNALATRIFSLIGAILESFIKGVSIGSGESKERFERRVGRHLQQEIESLVNVRNFAGIARSSMTSVVSDLGNSI